MIDKRICVLAVAAISLSACSSRPRYFEPTLASVPEDQAKYDEAERNCRTMVAEGQRSGFGARLASGGAGVAAGVGATAAALGGASSSMVGALAAASAAMVMMPVFGVAGAWGVAKAKKAKKERDTKQALTTCLTELGYTVSDWKVGKRPF